jgi:hypothetical protein
MGEPGIPQPSRAASGTWILVLCSAVALAVALVPCTGLLAQQVPTWLVIGAGAAVFPLLPLLWHGLAEAKRSDRGSAPSASRIRFSLRSLAIALLVLGVSLGELGPRRLVQNLSGLFGRIYSSPKTTSSPRVPSSQPVARHGLEMFIPADATLAVGLAGSAAMEQLLAAFGIDTRDKLVALATCKIDLENARVLIAARGTSHMIVLRAPGISDERNLYCLVGVMGSDRLQIRSEGTGASKTILVKGFLAQPWSFHVLDPTTVIATDQAWLATADKKMFSAGSDTAQGRLALPLQRLDRAATLWVASVADTARGAWDLALDARQEGSLFKLQGSSNLSSAEGDRAEIALRVPLAFASALPAGALGQGIRGVVAAVSAAGVSLPAPSPAAPTPAKPAAAVR